MEEFIADRTVCMKDTLDAVLMDPIFGCPHTTVASLPRVREKQWTM
jgi:hypothetical protein